MCNLCEVHPTIVLRSGAGEFVEYAHVHGNIYGTSKAAVEKVCVCVRARVRVRVRVCMHEHHACAHPIPARLQDVTNKRRPPW